MTGNYSFDKKQIILTATYSLGHETIHLTGNNFFSQGLLYIALDRCNSSKVLRYKDFVGTQFQMFTIKYLSKETLVSTE